MAPEAADNAPITLTTAARYEQEVGVLVAAVTSARPMEISSARTSTAEDQPRKMHRRSPGPQDLAGDPFYADRGGYDGPT
jgi:hypothetical protein